MHTTPQSSSDHTTHDRKTFLQKHSGTFLGLFLVMFLASLCASAYTAGILQVRPTRLILKPQGCALLGRYGVHTEPQDSSGACRATVMFRSSVFADALYLDDERIELAHDQIVAIAPSAKEVPWTGTQKRWADICTALIALTIAMAVLNEMGSRRHK